MRQMLCSDEVVRMKCEMITIKGDALKRELVKRSLDATEVSEHLGYNKYFISACANRGRMTPRVLKALKQEYNINPDSIVMKDETPEEEKAVPQVQDDVFDKHKLELWKMMYSAVYEAVKKAWSEL